MMNAIIWLKVMLMEPMGWSTLLRYLIVPALLYLVLQPVKTSPVRKPLGVCVIVGYTVLELVIFPLLVAFRVLVAIGPSYFDNLLRQWANTNLGSLLLSCGSTALLLVGAVLLYRMRKSSLFCYGTELAISLLGIARFLSNIISVPMVVSSVLAGFFSWVLICLYIGKLWRTGLLA